MRRSPQPPRRVFSRRRALNGELKRFLFARVYSNPAIAEERDRSVAALDELFTFYMRLSGPHAKQHAELAEAPTHRIVCDYIAGMTDHYLLRQHAQMLHRSTPQHDQ